jgi:hypothetical protein
MTRITFFFDIKTAFLLDKRGDNPIISPLPGRGLFFQMALFPAIFLAEQK